MEKKTWDNKDKYSSRIWEREKKSKSQSQEKSACII